MTTLSHTSILLLVVAAGALAIGGCGGRSVSYAKPATEHYDMLPLLRPQGASTYAVVAKGQDLPLDEIVIEGMKRVADVAAADLIVTVDYGGVALQSSGNPHSAYVCVAGPTVDRSGKEFDGTMAKDYQKHGFQEPVILGPLHLVVSHWQTGVIRSSGSYQVAAVSGTLSEGKLDASRSVCVGKALEVSYPFQEVVSFGGASASLGSGGEGPGEGDPASRRAQQHLDGSYADYQYLPTRDYFPRRKVEAIMKQMAAVSGSKGRQALAAAWQSAVQEASGSAPVLREMNTHLAHHYASGPRSIDVVYAEVDKDPALERAAALFGQMAKRPSPERDSLGEEALRILAAAQTKPDELRVRAAIQYNAGVIRFLMGDFSAAIAQLKQASAINAQKQDGIFGSSKKQLEDRVQHVLRSAEDRLARLVAQKP